MTSKSPEGININILALVGGAIAVMSGLAIIVQGIHVAEKRIDVRAFAEGAAFVGIGLGFLGISYESFK